MPDKLCEFTTEGIAAFSKWLRSGAPGSVPDDLDNFTRNMATPHVEALLEEGVSYI
jgi:hypothetical protein